jgi:gliding motility-associated-like protein
MQKSLHIWLILIALMTVTANISKAQTIDTVCASVAERVYRVQPTPGSTYYWQVEGGTITSSLGLDSIVVLWKTAPGTYNIKVVEQSKFGCFGDTVRAKVYIGKPVVSISGKNDICRGQAVMLTANGAKKYLWNTGETTQSIIALPNSNTNYSVVGFTECNPDTANFNVNVFDLPKADFSFSPKAPNLNEKVTFTYNGENGSQWEWIFNNGNTFAKDSNSLVTQYIYTDGGEKQVTLVVKNKAGCIDSVTYKIFVDAEAYIFIPTAFTPDGDNLNDVFKPVLTGIKNFELKIYNRWGENIKTLVGEGDSWDGTFRDQKVQEGVYIYTVTAKGNNNRNYYLNGVIKVLY